MKLLIFCSLDQIGLLVEEIVQRNAMTCKYRQEDDYFHSNAFEQYHECSLFAYYELMVCLKD